MLKNRYNGLKISVQLVRFMSIIQEQEVKKIAHLARLALEPEQIELYTTDLRNILSLIDQMVQFDSDGTPPLAHPLDQTLTLHADEVETTDSLAQLPINAPAMDAHLYLVPKVID